MVAPLRSGRGHTSAGDSAEEFIPTHALGRESLLVLSFGLSSSPLKILFYSRWETIREVLSQFSAQQPRLNRSLSGARHKSTNVE